MARKSRRLEARPLPEEDWRRWHERQAAAYFRTFFYQPMTNDPDPGMAAAARELVEDAYAELRKGPRNGQVQAA